MYQLPITLTHVCRTWRKLFISCSSLWTYLDLKNVDKTRTFIQRSKSSPLDIRLEYIGGRDYSDDDPAFSLVVPHIPRVKRLAIYGDCLPAILEHFRYHPLLLEGLHFGISIDAFDPPLDHSLSEVDLSSVRQLGLSGVTTYLPWRNLKNLKTIRLVSCFAGLTVTRLLDFFESTPLLENITLGDLLTDLPDASPGRTVRLPHLRTLVISSPSTPPLLLRHLGIPAGASLFLGFNSSGERSPLVDILSEGSPNLENLSHITTINLRFHLEQKFVQLSGPSGSLCVYIYWKDWTTISYAMEDEILRSLSPSILSTNERLAISQYTHLNRAQADGFLIFTTLSYMDSLRTLSLVECNLLPFVLALDPENNMSKSVTCPRLEELLLYIRSRDRFHMACLVIMAKNRASKGVKLSSITMVGSGEIAFEGDVFQLREHVTNVRCMVGGPPTWDDLACGRIVGTRRLVVHPG